MRGTPHGTLLGFVFALVAIPASAFAGAPPDRPAQQQPSAPDTRWSAWLGCWELITENVRTTARTSVVPLQSLEDGRPRICVTPTGDGARFETTVAGQPAVEYTIVPNAMDRPLDEKECRGTQRAEWSEDGLRLFARAQLTCDGDPATRRVSGIALIAPNGTWIDLQAVTVEGRENVRVRRYRRAGQTASTSRAVGGSLSLEDVKEASQKASSLAVEAALVETNAGYDLSGSKLIDLDAAGVPDTVIDLIVALSYPEKFVVERTSRATVAGPIVSDPFSLGWSYWNPVWYDDFYYSPYDSYRYSRFGPSSPFVEVIPVGGALPGPQPSGVGRVVDGLGYTRVRPRESEPADSGFIAPRTTSVSGGDGGSGGGSSTSSSSGSGSSGGTATSGGGYSSGSSSGDTGRTAVPR
jgi:hypothetical protein